MRLKMSFDYKSLVVKTVLAGLLTFNGSGCLLVAAGAGVEAGYVASQENRSTQETLNDQYVVSSIKTKLIANQEVSGLDINVDSFKGVVTLRGALRTQKEINTAIRIAKDTSGVSEVVSKLALVN